MDDENDEPLSLGVRLEKSARAQWPPPTHFLPNTRSARLGCDVIHRPSKPALVNELPAVLQRQLPCVATAFAEFMLFPLSKLPHA